MIKVLGSLTKSKLILQSELSELISSNKCKYLNKDRSYSAPVGLFAKNDVKNAAKGIDEWIELDKGMLMFLRIISGFRMINRDLRN
ncbi:hypothetical protein [Chryseobacterium oryzae]|uniref:Uncharacterized protein n=1 Tax=Chryseobacterium oryzae TaxID=2929799 RepID=A0ABY4BCL7_9FLAO|nr:hypothetical protein [Chryseobacterium oryzae]UOE36890.1 hypothetical protein MTP08_07370 [Chryseobacterium oryzae]